jgi:hypothetical protein
MLLFTRFSTALAQSFCTSRVLCQNADMSKPGRPTDIDKPHTSCLDVPLYYSNTMILLRFRQGLRSAQSFFRVQNIRRNEFLK